MPAHSYHLLTATYDFMFIILKLFFMTTTCLLTTFYFFYFLKDTWLLILSFHIALK